MTLFSLTVMVIQRLNRLLNFQLVLIIRHIELTFLHLNFRDYFISVTSIVMFRKKYLIFTQFQGLVLLFKKAGFDPVFRTVLWRFLVMSFRKILLAI